jgi:DNA helicase HerA-like ATPase
MLAQTPDTAITDNDRASLVPIGRTSSGALSLNLERLLAGRCLIQGSSGAGKSATLRKIIEEAFDYVTVMLVDPEGEFHNLAAHIGATTLFAAELSNEGLTAAAARGRQHRLALHIDLTDLEPDQRIEKAAAFFAGLIGAPREHWGNTVLVAVDEAQLLAPHVAASSQDAASRRLGVATLVDLASRGRKRGIGTILATHRLAKLASSVVSELQNHLIGLNVFDRDISRAADLLGFSNDQASWLRKLKPGEFYAFGPALSATPVLTVIDPTITPHTSSTPSLLGAADVDAAAARSMLDLDALGETRRRSANPGPMRSARALDGFLLDPAAATAARIVAALQKIAPNATSADELVRHLGTERGDVDSALDLLANIGAVDTMPRGADRLARLAARLRLRVVDTPVVGLA